MIQTRLLGCSTAGSVRRSCPTGLRHLQQATISKFHTLSHQPTRRTKQKAIAAATATTQQEEVSWEDWVQEDRRRTTVRPTADPTAEPGSKSARRPSRLRTRGSSGGGDDGGKDDGERDEGFTISGGSKGGIRNRGEDSSSHRSRQRSRNRSNAQEGGVDAEPHAAAAGGSSASANTADGRQRLDAVRQDVQQDRRQGSISGSSRWGRDRGSSGSGAARALNQQLQGAGSCQELLRVLQELQGQQQDHEGGDDDAAQDSDAQDDEEDEDGSGAKGTEAPAAAAPAALTPVNVASAWVRLANLRTSAAFSSGSGGETYGRGADGGGAADADAESTVEGAACASVIRLLLGPTVAAVAQMDLRQAANTVWAVAKLEQQVASATSPPARSGKRRGSFGAGGSGGGGRSRVGRLPELLQPLQRRVLELLQPLTEKPKAAATASAEKHAGKGRTAALLDLRDAAQLWYGVATTVRHTWDEQLVSELVEATLRKMEAVVASNDNSDSTAAAETRTTRAAENGSGRYSRRPDGDDRSANEDPDSSSSSSCSTASFKERTAVAQLIFRMGALVGPNLVSEHKARLTALVDILSRDLAVSPAAAAVEGAAASGLASSTSSSPSSSSPARLDNPDCLLTGARLMRLSLPPETVRQLHDATLALPPAAAARVGRTAMARALHSAVQMGLQPSLAEAKRWQRRLVAEFSSAGGARWRSSDLSWTMLALSGVEAYVPDPAARDGMVRAVCGALREARANDATRIRAAVTAWGLRLPERERALLAQKAGAEEEADVEGG
ncbi:hypothetical protein Agub_g15460, partial [Astrephomene gubernaculifera]